MLLFYVLFLLPIVAAVSALLYAPFAIRTRRRLGKKGALYHLARFALVGCVLSLVYLTLLWYFPDITFHPAHHFLNLRPFVWVTQCYDMGFRRMIRQLLLNVAMFIPLGFLLPVTAEKARKGWVTVSIVLLSTLAIETLQFFLGRSADIDDVIMNTLGGVIGYGVFRLANRAFRGQAWWKQMLG